MNILVIGSGGREHALCWKLRQSPLTEKLYCAPGNAGIADVAECVNIGVEDGDKLAEFAKANNIDYLLLALRRSITNIRRKLYIFSSREFLIHIRVFNYCANIFECFLKMRADVIPAN